MKRPEFGRPVVFPERYGDDWRAPFERPILERMAEGSAVLDIGSGRHPAITPDRRPLGVQYVGLDLSASELAAAGEGAYTEVVEADAAALRPELEDRFDLVVSWQVLEHVRDLESTITHIHRYVRPGGTFVALFSGAWAAFAVANRLIPNRAGSKIVDRIMHRTAANMPVFPAFYDRCYYSPLRRMLASWTEFTITPLFGGAGYFRVAPPIQRLYLEYENVIARRPVKNLATHYLVVATR